MQLEKTAITSSPMGLEVYVMHCVVQVSIDSACCGAVLLLTGLTSSAVTV